MRVNASIGHPKKRQRSALFGKKEQCLRKIEVRRIGARRKKEAL